MNVYDAVIADVNRCLASYTPKVWPANPDRAAKEGGKNQLILGSEAAYELGALSCDSVSCLLLTEDAEQVPRDEVVLYGPDLPEIKGDCSFARITVLRTEDITRDGEQAAFAIIKGIETKKYGVYPEGYMIRAAAFSNREQARVSRKALDKGLTFEQVGNLFIRQYRRSRFVQTVKVIFITLP